MKVIIYTKNNDAYSDMIRNLLKTNNIEFEMVDVSRNKERFKEMQEISGQSNTPVIQIDDKVFLGFDREKIKEVLGLNK
ncbi:glutaredoxin family protein [Candidatus Woesearchaeota archaeon]|nr:glutaredoxin family protein [Candidatus Woesearchaeota archaeon]